MQSTTATKCPYLHTVNRDVLDFDLDKACMVTLSRINVYMCLVCGKYLAGRSPTSPAYLHSINARHHLFMHLQTDAMYCLPEGYRVQDASLADVAYNLHPTYDSAGLTALRRQAEYVRARNGKLYLPGFLGINTPSRTSWFSAGIYLVAHIPPIRDHFLMRYSEQHLRNVRMDGRQPPSKHTRLADLFGAFCASIWHRKRFTTHVLPHELLQEVVRLRQVFPVALPPPKKPTAPHAIKPPRGVQCSKPGLTSGMLQEFRIGCEADVFVFVSWFLQMLHLQLGGTSQPDSSIIYSALRGELAEVTTTAVEYTTTSADPGRTQTGSVSVGSETKTHQALVTKVRSVPFLYLSLALPQNSLFKDEDEKALIPQVHISELLSKFQLDLTDTTTLTASDSTSRGSHQKQTRTSVPSTANVLQRRLVSRRLCIARLPPYLMLHFQRLGASNEKNPTLVTFPLTSLDLTAYVAPVVLPEGKENTLTTQQEMAGGVNAGDDAPMRQSFEGGRLDKILRKLRKLRRVPLSEVEMQARFSAERLRGRYRKLLASMQACGIVESRSGANGGANGAGGGEVGMDHVCRALAQYERYMCGKKEHLRLSQGLNVGDDQSLVGHKRPRDGDSESKTSKGQTKTTGTEGSQKGDKNSGSKDGERPRIATPFTARYDLITSITQGGGSLVESSGSGRQGARRRARGMSGVQGGVSYRSHIRHQPSHRWMELAGLSVDTDETLAQLISVSEAYLQVYTRV